MELADDKSGFPKMHHYIGFSQIRSHFYKYYTQIGSMYAWTMLTEFNCQSATCVRNTVILYYIHMIIILSNTCHVCTWYCFVHFCYKIYAEVPLLELLEGPHQPLLDFPKDLLAKRNLCTAASRVSGLVAKIKKWCWLHYDEVQDALFCFICVLWYTYMLMVIF